MANVKSEKVTENFKNAIEQHLDLYALQDNLFEKSYKNPKKNLEDCIQYILNTVQSSGQQGFTDEEIFGMARHYYDESDIDIGKKIDTSDIVVNHVPVLTEAEIEEAKKKAYDQVISEEKSRLRKKPEKKKASSEKGDSEQTNTLFKL